MKFVEFLKNAASYRTVISILVSMVLKVLVAKRVLGAESLAQADDITNLVLTAASVLADGCGIFFRLKATKPGVLTPQFAAHEAWVKSGVDRRGAPEQGASPEQK